jgi:hypothetical protein
MKKQNITFKTIIAGGLIFLSAVIILTIFPPKVQNEEPNIQPPPKRDYLLRAYQIEIIDSTVYLFDRYRYVGEIVISKTQNSGLDSLIWKDNE